VVDADTKAHPTVCMPLSSLPGCGVQSYREYASNDDKNDCRVVNGMGIGHHLDLVTERPLCDAGNC